MEFRLTFEEVASETSCIETEAVTKVLSQPLFVLFYHRQKNQPAIFQLVGSDPTYTFLQLERSAFQAKDVITLFFQKILHCHTLHHHLHRLRLR